MITKTSNVAEVMTKDVISVLPTALMEEVAEIFENNPFHHIPVVDENKQVKGMISKVEFHKLQHGFTVFELKAAQDFNRDVFSSVSVDEMMNNPVAKLYPDDTLEQAMGYFRENLFHAAPVVNRTNGHLVGLVTTYDLLTAFYESASAALV